MELQASRKTHPPETFHVCCGPYVWSEYGRTVGRQRLSDRTA